MADWREVTMTKAVGRLRITALMFNVGDYTVDGSELRINRWNVVLHCRSTGKAIAMRIDYRSDLGKPTPAIVLNILVEDAMLITEHPTFDLFCKALALDVSGDRANTMFDAVVHNTELLVKLVGLSETWNLVHDTDEDDS